MLPIGVFSQRASLMLLTLKGVWILTTVGFALAVLGTLFAVSALIVDLIERHARPEICALMGTRTKVLQLRKTKSIHENHRQFWWVLASLPLIALALVHGSPVYVALESFLLASSILWYLPVHRNEEISDQLKEYLRLVCAVCVWVVLEVNLLVPGFHRIGVIGLELTGCAVVIARSERTREVLQLSGSIALTIYAICGIVLDPEHLTEHVTWGSLNLLFTLVAIGVMLAPRKQQEAAC